MIIITFFQVELKEITIFYSTLNSATTGTITFPIIQKYVYSFVTVSEKEIIDTLHYLWTRLKIVAEPSGAVSVAAVMHNKFPLKGKKIGAVISGGNADVKKMAQLFSEVQD